MKHAHVRLVQVTSAARMEPPILQCDKHDGYRICSHEYVNSLPNMLGERVGSIEY